MWKYCRSAISIFIICFMYICNTSICPSVFEHSLAWYVNKCESMKCNMFWVHFPVAFMAVCYFQLNLSGFELSIALSINLRCCSFGDFFLYFCVLFITWFPCRSLVLLFTVKISGGEFSSTCGIEHFPNFL